MAEQPRRRRRATAPAPHARARLPAEDGGERRRSQQGGDRRLIRFTNTLTRTARRLRAAAATSSSMYVCGITPYDESHIGHAMSYIVFDVVKRYLQWRGYTVKHVQNFTDIDDRIIERANRLKITTDELVEKYIGLYTDDMRDLNVLPADEYPHATQRGAGDDRDHRAARSRRATPTRRPRRRASGRTSTTASPRRRTTASSRIARRTRCSPARASRPASRRRTPPTSRSGRARRPASRRGTARGARAAPAGTSSARRCR